MHPCLPVFNFNFSQKCLHRQGDTINSVSNWTDPAERNCMKIVLPKYDANEHSNKKKLICIRFYRKNCTTKKNDNNNNRIKNAYELWNYDSYLVHVILRLFVTVQITVINFFFPFTLKYYSTTYFSNAFLS